MPCRPGLPLWPPRAGMSSDIPMFRKFVTSGTTPCSVQAGSKRMGRSRRHETGAVRPDRQLALALSPAAAAAQSTTADAPRSRAPATHDEGLLDHHEGQVVARTRQARGGPAHQGRRRTPGSSRCVARCRVPRERKRRRREIARGIGGVSVRQQRAAESSRTISGGRWKPKTRGSRSPQGAGSTKDASLKEWPASACARTTAW